MSYGYFNENNEINAFLTVIKISTKLTANMTEIRPCL